MLSAHLQNKQIMGGFSACVSRGCVELEGMVSTGGQKAHLITGQYFTHSDVFLKHFTNFQVKF